MKLRILVACEYSGRVRDAFAAQGWDAWSCDFEPTETPGHHHQGDVFEIIGQPWDALICFPPCTYICASGMHWTTRGLRDPALTDEAVAFAMRLFGQDHIPRIAMENPIGCLSTRFREPDQIIQPWQFGHGETKATCLWLKGLPPLVPSNIVQGRESICHRMPPGPDRWKNRSRTYQGIADAMADQWGQEEFANPVQKTMAFA